MKKIFNTFEITILMISAVSEKKSIPDSPENIDIGSTHNFYITNYR